MSLSVAGLVGALVGLAIAWLDWKMVSGILRARHAQKALTTQGAQRQQADRRLNVVLGVVFVVLFVGIPLVGYMTGVAIGS